MSHTKNLLVFDKGIFVEGNKKVLQKVRKTELKNTFIVLQAFMPMGGDLQHPCKKCLFTVFCRGGGLSDIFYLRFPEL